MKKVTLHTIPHESRTTPLALYKYQTCICLISVLRDSRNILKLNIRATEDGNAKFHKGKRRKMRPVKLRCK